MEIKIPTVAMNGNVALEMDETALLPVGQEAFSDFLDDEQNVFLLMDDLKPVSIQSMAVLKPMLNDEESLLESDVSDHILIDPSEVVMPSKDLFPKMEVDLNAPQIAEANDSSAVVTVENAQDFDLGLGIDSPLLKIQRHEAKMAPTSHASEKTVIIEEMLPIRAQDVKLSEATPVDEVHQQMPEVEIVSARAQRKPIFDENPTKIHLAPVMQQVILETVGSSKTATSMLKEDSLVAKSTTTSSEQSMIPLEAMTTDASQSDLSGQTSDQESGAQNQNQEITTPILMRASDNLKSEFSVALSDRQDLKTQSFDVVRQIELPIRQAISQDETFLTIRLDPEALGEVEISFEIKDNTLHRVIFRTDVIESRDVLSSQTDRIQEIFQEAGIQCDVGAFEFSSREQQYSQENASETRETQPQDVSEKADQSAPESSGGKRISNPDALVDIEI